MNPIYGEFIPLFSGYVPPKRKWYQKVFDFLYNIREVISGIILFAIWISMIILFVKLGYTKVVLICVPVGLMFGLMFGLISGGSKW
jgi:hypothetical protein